MAVQEFSIRWEGSVIAEETGTYEFIVQSENGVRLRVNDPKNLLIDAGITEGKMREERKSIFLLGGRAYPITRRVFEVQGKDRVHRLEVEAAARGRGSDPAAQFSAATAGARP